MIPEIIIAASISIPWPSITCANDPRLQNGKYAAVYSTESKDIVLSLNLCGHLNNLKNKLGPVYYEEVHAIFTLTHEIVHAEGISDEHLADCRAELLWEVVTRKLRITFQKTKALRMLIYKYKFPLILHQTIC